MPEAKSDEMRRRPWTIYCQKVATPRIDRPLSITPISRTPTMAPRMWNRPGLSVDAPMKTDAKAFRRWGSPIFSGRPAPKVDDTITPPSAEHTAQIESAAGGTCFPRCRIRKHETFRRERVGEDVSATTRARARDRSKYRCRGSCCRGKVGEVTQSRRLR